MFWDRTYIGPPPDLQDRWTSTPSSRCDELRDELATLCKQAYVPNAVQLEPPIQNNSDSTTENYTQDRGDIGIRGFWVKQFDCIVYYTYVDYLYVLPIV